ncbi:MAG: TetR/AcrR family transcriptional regulator [Candidatus Cloacimonetes bacterium]|nr:TetR/AcrR family transcriptional regulator [Candidatus Cloacimonadota bacterium]
MTLTERQQQIIDTAIKIIANKGLKSCTIKNLSEAINISEPAIYRHFKSKEEILLTMLHHFETVSNELLKHLQNIDLSPLEKIKAFLENRYRVFNENPDLASVMMADDLFTANPKLLEVRSRIIKGHRDLVIEIVSQGQQAGKIRHEIEPKQIFLIIFGSMRLLVKQWSNHPEHIDLTVEGKKLWKSIRVIIQA